MLIDLLFIARIFALYLLLCVGCFLMLLIIMGYRSFQDDAQFLALKQAYVTNPFWKAAFYIHVFTAIVTLFAGFTQFSASFFRDHRLLHRRIGKLYAYAVLFINAPVGMVLAICANGLLPGKAAFILLDILWFYFTYRAVDYARKKDFSAHRAYMIRSYALTLSALTLRAWKVILVHHFSMDPVHLYMLEAWLGFVPNLLVAEWIVRNGRRKPDYLPKAK